MHHHGRGSGSARFLYRYLNNLYNHSNYFNIFVHLKLSEGKL